MTGDPPTIRDRAVAGLLAATIGVGALVVAACADDPSPSPPPDPRAGFPGRLAVLTGSPGQRRLVAYADGATTALELPADETTWIAADSRGELAATQADGTILVQPPWSPAWQVIDPGTLPALGGQPLMATWSPGGRLGSIVADVGSARVTGALILDPETGASRFRRLGIGLEGSPPAWLSDTLLAIPGRDQDLPRVTVLDDDDGSTLVTPRSIRTVAASADGSTLALISGDAAEVEVWRTTPWLVAQRTGTSAPDDARLAVLRPPPGAIRPASLVLDPAADHLAVAWSDADGTTRWVTVHLKGGAWAAAFLISVEPTSAVPALAWLP